MNWFPPTVQVSPQRDPVKPGMAGREWGMGNGEWGMYMYLAMGCILVHSNTNVKEKVYNYSAYT